MSPKDQKIITAIEQGNDDKAINGLYDSSFRKIRDFVKKNAGSNEDAEDVFQDAIVIFYKQVKTGKFDGQYEIDGFLYAVARNVWINKAKRDQRKLPLADTYQAASDLNLQQQLIDQERAGHIQQLFEKIGDKCKELLTLVIYHDYSMKEVADKMQLANENAAKTQHYKCKQKLVELVGENEQFKRLLKDAIR